MLHKAALVFFISVILSRSVAGNWKYQTFDDDAGRNGFSTQLRDILENLGLFKPLNNANSYVEDKVNKAQQYDRYQADWQQLKSQPFNVMNVIDFLRNTTLPAIVYACARLQDGTRSIYLEVMNFTRKQCDKFLGSKAALHPWNVIKQNRETVSFLVFVYAMCMALILFKLCSFWNFLGWLTFGYVTYIFAGPYWCFKWLVFITGVFWYLFDMVLKYPLQMAVFFLIWYSWSYLSLTSYITRRYSKPGFTSIPQTPAATEFRYLKGKMSLIEDRTDEIQKKVAELEVMLKRMDFGKD